MFEKHNACKGCEIQECGEASNECSAFKMIKSIEALLVEDDKVYFISGVLGLEIRKVIEGTK